MKYVFKEWDEMKEEFGTKRGGHIACDVLFTIDMKYLCGTEIDELGKNKDGFYITKDMVKLNKKRGKDMNINNLRTGDFVELRDGNIYMVMRGTKEFWGKSDFLISIDTGNFIRLANYGKNGLDKKDSTYLGIMKIVSHGYVGDNWREVIVDKNINWTWERTEMKEMTMDEIIKELGYDVKIVKGDK